MQINVIGIGAGNPQHLTLEAIAALQESDAVVALDKGENKADLLGARQYIIATHAPGIPLITVSDPPRDRDPADYRAEVRRWHQARAQLLLEALPDVEQVAFLVWGDPALYDSTLRIIERMRGLGLDCSVRVIPGITAVHALTAAHGILLNRIGEDIRITTGRALLDGPTTNAVVMLDGGAAWLDVPDAQIWWGAYLGTELQVLRSGTVAEIGAGLAEEKAALREQHGWIMDIYLLRR
ncbi:precorrin-6A synthase (deacetylating) [Corynebacterium epidermidicanis]|uniref:Precorrin-6A synthase (Deacetylating) n=1 Tax=Corynebacterium epidermidicanis TaxID=1050174 RepID=A0A0G3GSY4_9CORY|nr:precorrin-6A synthase (deacetylating) [Corynebacterium epidermidicanis]AKK02628.1 precorrin-6A synthase (deacetylating) [Corynebacterium epidermidicanis]